MLAAKDNWERNRVLKPASPGAQAALIYGMLFVALMLAVGKTLTADNLALPAAALFLVVNGCNHIERKSRKNFQQAIIVGAFLSAITCALVMTFLVS